MPLAKCTSWRVTFILLSAAIAAVQAMPSAQAISTRVVATVNDTAISAYQVQQRVKLLRVLGEAPSSGTQLLKFALQDLIGEQLKRQEAKRLKVGLGREQIDKVIEKSPYLKNLSSRLKSEGLSSRLVKDYFVVRLTWNRIVANRYGKPDVNDAQIDAKFAQLKAEFQKIAADQSVTLFELLPITLPVDRQATPELTQEVARSRMIEADRLAKRFKSCRSARKAALGIFNVKFGKRMQADPRRMPKQMRNSLRRAGPGSAFVMGAAPDLSSVQILAYCGRKKISPQIPKITREAVRERLLDDRYKNLGKSYLRDLRKNAFIEYKDPSLRR